MKKKNKQIAFFQPTFSNSELNYISDIFKHKRVISGDGKYTKLASTFLEKRHSVKKVLLTTSGTTALEMAVKLLSLKPGSEIICPSFTFSSTANAILLAQGLRIVFADINKKTLNIDPEDVSKRITKNTKAIMLVHYAGVSCDFDAYKKLANIYDIRLIEDAAQAIDSKWRNQYLGTIGDFGCLSFHETKNIVCGEGGALYLNQGGKKSIEKAEIIREKGTNRTKYFRGQVDKYTWVDIGSSYLPSDILAAVLFAQLKKINFIQKRRMSIWKTYFSGLKDISTRGYFLMPYVPEYAKHNAHMFYIICESKKIRDNLMLHLRNRCIMASFHYIPLDSSPQGKQLLISRNFLDCPNSKTISEKILRLPIHANLELSECEEVIQEIHNFYLN